MALTEVANRRLGLGRTDTPTEVSRAASGQPPAQSRVVVVSEGAVHSIPFGRFDDPVGLLAVLVDEPDEPVAEPAAEGVAHEQRDRTQGEDDPEQREDHHVVLILPTASSSGSVGATPAGAP